MTAASMGRQTRGVIHGLAAQMSGRSERGRDRKVRRHSYDVDDRRAAVSRPIGDGSVAGALGWIDCLLKTVSEWDDFERKKGGARPLGMAGLRVLETLLGRRGKIALDFRTGRLDPAIDTIARVAVVGRTTVVRALARLKAMGILDWVRRTQTTDNAGGYGPQREQVSNSYWFSPERLPARVLRRFRDLLARKARARANVASAAPPGQPQPSDPAWPTDPALASAVAGLGAAVEDASPPCGQYPNSGVEG